MGIREAINRNPKVGFALGAVLVVCSIAAVIWLNSSGVPGAQSQAFFSTDDGKTYFADSIERVPPFEHDGQQAYRAYVYRYEGQEPFVHYLSRFKENARAKAQELSGDDSLKAQSEMADLIASGGMEVKPPGPGEKWVTAGEAEAVRIMSAPSQGSNPQAVYP